MVEIVGGGLTRSGELGSAAEGVQLIGSPRLEPKDVLDGFSRLGRAIEVGLKGGDEVVDVGGYGDSWEGKAPGLFKSLGGWSSSWQDQPLGS